MLAHRIKRGGMGISLSFQTPPPAPALADWLIVDSGKDNGYVRFTNSIPCCMLVNVCWEG